MAAASVDGSCWCVREEDRCRRRQQRRRRGGGSGGGEGEASVMSVTAPSVFLGACLGVCVFLLCVGGSEGSMDITAFEYFRKFGKHLELGECPQRELLVTSPNNSTTFIVPESCKARQKGNITNVPRELNDTRHVIIPTANDLVAYLGLCGGEAASYLGILNNAGDCVAVEIASKLSFNKKTMIRAYVEYYRKSLDILDTASDYHGSIREGFNEYVSDKFYVKNRSYGTLEIVLVQFRFRSRKETEMAKDLKVSSRLMSEYMRKVEREVGKPRRVMVLSLSTATEETYRLNKYDDQHWGKAVRDVELREVVITQRRKLIDSGRIRPHLNYQLFPFVPRKGQSYRISSPLTWEATSMLEVSLRVSIGIAKKTAKRCRGDRSKMCRRVRELRRKLTALQSEIHKGRSSWVTFTSKEQQDFASRYTARVSTYASVTKSLSRAVRRLKKQQKLDRLHLKKRRRNLVPLDQQQKKQKQQQRRIRRLQQKRDRAPHVHRLMSRREQRRSA
ncbi:uncharacterized protein LOC143288804 [Babylonia areolata]|uniref:uncharacterized protein LOC143288804 n=1 Tax=Babylonia areolata TaxID=304850 RepID=UPI003FD0CE5F